MRILLLLELPNVVCELGRWAIPLKGHCWGWQGTQLNLKNKIITGLYCLAASKTLH